MQRRGACDLATWQTDQTGGLGHPSPAASAAAMGAAGELFSGSAAVSKQVQAAAAATGVDEAQYRIAASLAAVMVDPVPHPSSKGAVHSTAAGRDRTCSVMWCLIFPPTSGKRWQRSAGDDGSKQ